MKTKLTILLFLLTIAITAQGIKFGKVSEEELKEKFHPLDSTASAAYLYKYRTTNYEYNETEGFVVVTKVHERIKIYNKKGLRYANKLVSYYKPETGDEEKVTGIKGYTFNLEDGVIVKEKLSNKQVFDEKKTKYWSNKKIAMPAVKVGAVLDLKYQMRSPYHTYIKDVQFQYGIPVKEYETKIEIPEYFVFRKNSKGYFYIKPIESSLNKSINFSNRNRVSNNYQTRSSVSYSSVEYKSRNSVFKANNIPALKDNEPYVGNIENYRGAVSYEISSVQFPNSILKNYSVTWEDVSKTIYRNENFGNELKKNNYFEKDLQVILNNVTSDGQKIGEILQFVKSKVKWNKYKGKYTDKGVKKAYKEGVGNVADINLMLTAMLREAGLNANPVLVSSKDNGIPIFPTRDGFDYVITMVDFNNDGYALLDATELYSMPNVLPKRVLNWNGRKIMKDGSSSWVSLLPTKHAVENHKVFVKLTKDNTLEGLCRSVFKNTEALDYRINNNKLKEEDVISNLESAFKFEIDEFKVLNENDLVKPVVRSIKFSKDEGVEEINGKLYISPLLFLTIEENPFKADERKFPVDFVKPWQDKTTISLTLPDGYKIESLPEALAIGLPDELGFFKCKITHVGGKINIQSITQFNKPLIAPQYYPELKEFYAKLVSKQSEKIVLVKE